jgi:hypothetical protein
MAGEEPSATSAQGPGQPPTDVAPPGYQGPAAYQQPTYAAPPPTHHGHAGPWILGAAALLVAGLIAAVLIHNNGAEIRTQTVINRTPTVNATTVAPQRSAPSVTVTQPTTTVATPKTVTTPTSTATTP